MSKLSRRQAVRRIAQSTAAASIASLASPAKFLFATATPAAKPAPQPQARRTDLPTGQENAAMFRLGRAFMTQFFAPALSVSIVRDSKFVYEHAWGVADSKQHIESSDTSLFRIASVTKPITSVAIFTLLERGKLNLNDKVFGPSGILAEDYGKSFRQYVTDVTVDHLLTHTSGGWPNDDTDPMFKNNSWDHKRLITDAIATLPLTYAPGTHWAYSNFGYCILGRVIEKISGQPYETFVQQSVLAPCGITDMRVAGNTYRDRAPNEVEYLGQFNENPYNMNVRRMDSHGGWIATPNDLAKFTAHLGGTSTIPSILKPASIKLMTTPAPAYSQDSDAKYARGWMVRDNGAGNWWHAGSLPGTTSVMVRTPDGKCWGALTNTRTQPSDAINTALDQMVWDMVHQVPAWNA
ncbi:MAG TPA: serine hydrolase domain-containing protein [Candidatus Acidoferrum sp.]|nr:serine hydrolase domain-containing protein [Candidatus Acidoferrum sp.]